jgi:hypothetical protein
VKCDYPDRWVYSFFSLRQRSLVNISA